MRADMPGPGERCRVGWTDQAAGMLPAPGALDKMTFGVPICGPMAVGGQPL
jgi:hypothetical protein